MAVAATDSAVADVLTAVGTGVGVLVEVAFVAVGEVGTTTGLDDVEVAR